MNKTDLKFQEEYSAKIPALALLCNLGWTFLSPDQALSMREGKKSNVVFDEVLRTELRKRRFIFNGNEYPLSEQSIDKLVNQICTPAMNEGLNAANPKNV